MCMICSIRLDVRARITREQSKEMLFVFHCNYLVLHESREIQRESIEDASDGVAARLKALPMPASLAAM